MRRKALAVLAVLALLMPMFLAIGGMSAVRAQDASPGASPAVDTSISGELNVAMVANPQMVALQKLAPEFQKIYPNIKLNLLVLPENEVRDRIRTDVSTQAGQFDVVTIGMFEAADYAKQGWSLDVGTPLQADPNYDYQDIFPAMVSALSGDDGKLYAAPFYGESSMVFYRKDLFQAAGLTMPDKPTWDDIQGFAQKLHKPDSGQYGICLRGLPGWGEQGAPLTSVINAFGGRWFDENWKSQLASDKSAKAIKFYTDLVKNYGEPSATTSGFTECENLFIQGKVAMWYDATSAADLLADPKQNPQAANTGFAYQPTEEIGSGWLWAWAFAIEAKTKHQDAALAFVKWATSKDYVNLVANQLGWGSVPSGVRASTYADAGYKEYGKSFADLVLSIIQAQDPTKCCVDAVPYKGLQFVGVPEFVTLGDQVTKELANVIAGNESADDAIKKIDDMANSWAKDNGYQ
ncbi:MAG TPA: sugar ABC transporter substrate-binding protein [Thermomicrobiales bacterium]|nr:sugar ABC transporter substrate-binding protein [Thermomicrobiales bacterium]